MIVAEKNHSATETHDESPRSTGRRFHLIALVLLLAALVLDLAGKSYASRAITTIATGGDRDVVAESTEMSGLLTQIGLIVAACGGICGVVSITKGERGPHWPMMLAAGLYAVFFGIAP